MPQALTISAVRPDPALFDLPWSLPLEQWPEDVILALPRGISRHVVRFVKLSNRVLAIKEIAAYPAAREYNLLKELAGLDAPSVAPVAVVSGRTGADDEPLDAALLTEHLQFSLPYRALFSYRLRPDMATRLLDALALLIVRLHLIGFYWGDVSLSNTLFRRDAKEFSAYLVDAETGALHDALTDGQRAYDLDLARTNVIGELMDLEAGSMLEDELDPIAVGDFLVDRYDQLWRALTEEETISSDARWRLQDRINRLNDLGFDVAEMSMSTSPDGTVLHIRPQVVDAGHHSRRLFRLTGLDVQENQARRLLNDLDTYRIHSGQQDVEEDFVAHDWLMHVFEPAVRAVPRALRGKLELPQIYHEILEHRWFMSQRESRFVPLEEAVASYIDNVLSHRRDESELILADTLQLPAADDVPMG
ncbi:MAG: DUF4032 domain-containing protein [Bifidobacteriaceae bacterium]|jgi:hypothetical protein|nr:DUF4032 domain-containing protein [Bifidobacteriaceae bacterium]